MKVYVVCYDLHEADSKDYEEIQEAIAAICPERYAHVEESVYLVCSNLSAKVIRDRLKSKLTKGSRLLVSPVETGSAWFPGGDELVDWFKNARARSKH